MSWFLLLLPEPEASDPDAAVGWARAGSRGGIIDRGVAPAAELVRQLRRGDRCVAVVPGERVLLQRVTIPARSRSARLQALPFALEERLSEDLESLHIVSRDSGPGGAMLAAVVARRDMQAWLRWLTENGLRPQWMLPDTLLLKPVEDRLRLFCADDRCLVDSPDGEAVALAPELVPWWLAQAGERRLEWHGRPEQMPDELRDRPDVVLQEWNGDWAALLAPGLIPRPALNLLTGSFGQGGIDSGAWRHWRLPAGFAAALVLAWTVSLHLEIRQIEHEIDSVDRAIAESFAAALPGTRMVDPVRQFRQVLEAGGNSGSSASGPLAGRLGQVAPVLARSGATLRQLRADADLFEVELDMPDIAALDRLRTGLAEATTSTVRIMGVESADQGVRARLQVERGGP